MVGSFVDQITAGIKGTVIRQSVRMFGGSMSSDCFAGFLDQITIGKKVQSSGHRLQWLGGRFHELRLFWPVRRYVFWQVPQSNYKLRSEKRYSHLAICWNVYYVLLTYYTLVDRPSTMRPWGIYPGRKIPALTWGLVNNVEPVPAKSEPTPKQFAGK